MTSSPTITQHLQDSEYFTMIANEIVSIFDEEEVLNPNASAFTSDRIMRGSVPRFVNIECSAMFDGERERTTLHDIPTEWFDQFNAKVVRAAATLAKQKLDEEDLRTKQSIEAAKPLDNQ